MPTTPGQDHHNELKGTVMIHRKYIAALAGSLALLGLTACAGAADTATEAAYAAPTAPAVTTTPQHPSPPPLPLPETQDYRSITERAFLSALDDEGITLDDETALDAAELACNVDGLLPATRQVAEFTGLLSGDAAYLVGAAMITCVGSDQ